VEPGPHRYDRSIETTYQDGPDGYRDEPGITDLPEGGDLRSRAARMRERGRQRRIRAGRTNIRSIRFLRALAVAEATAFLLLILCAFTKPHLFGIDCLFVMGNVHGAIFTSYLVAIFVFRNKVGWGPLALLMVLVAGLVPGGGIMVERWALHPPRS
jgi:integral membrane protein